MLKLRLNTKDDGAPIVILGITDENVTRLLAGDPIGLDLSELELPSIKVFVFHGKDEQALMEKFEEQGLVPDGLSKNMPANDGRIHRRDLGDV